MIPDPDQGVKKHRFVEPMTHRRPGSTHPLVPFAYESREAALRTAVEVAFALTDAERSDVAISTFVCDGTGKAELHGTRIDHHRGSLTLESLGALGASQAA